MRWRSRAAPAPSAPPEPTAPVTGDIEFVIGQTADWIRNADAKTGLLLAGLTVLLSSLSPHVGDLRTLWTGDNGRPAALWLLAAAVVLLALAFGLLVVVLVPRTRSAGATRYAWPWLERTSVEELVRLDPDSLRLEGWRQAKQLAAIATFKYRYFTAAVWFSALSVACFLAWSVARGAGP